MEKKNREPIICECTKCMGERNKYIRKYHKIPNYQTTMFPEWEMKENY